MYFISLFIIRTW